MKLLFLFLFPILSFAQQQALTGTVVYSSQQSISNATVRLLHSNTSAVTGANGNFTISILTLPDTLLVTHVGYHSKQLILTAFPASPLNITLEPLVNTLHDVTVSTGYQDLPKERATGSFEKIDNASLNRTFSTGILSRLEGNSSILFDKNTNRPALTVRGVSSINGPKDPLIILDNFPYEGNINNINPNDVESITVLKDAAAASIWGTRAGNGVIVIVSKKGRYNQPFRLQLNTNVSFISKPNLYYRNPISSSDFIDVEQFLYSKGFYNTQINNTSRPPLSPAVEIMIKKANGQLPADVADEQLNALRNVDVRNQFSRYVYRQGINRQYALNMNGGSKIATFFISAGYDDNVTNLDAKNNRVNVRSDNTFKPLKDLDISASIMYTRSASATGRSGFESFSRQPYEQWIDDRDNTIPVYRNRQTYIDTAGKGRLLDWKLYPLEDYKHNNAKTTLHDVLLNIGLQYRFTKALQATARYQYEKQDNSTRNLKDEESYFTRDLINRFTQINLSTGVVKYNVPRGSILDINDASTVSNSFRTQLNYNTSFGHHTLSAIAGNEVRQVTNNSNAYTVYGYNNNINTVSNVDYVNSYPNYINGFSSFVPSNLSFSDRVNRFVSLYANAAYTYNARYTFSASARKDASNLFGVKTNDKWQPLWSVGGAWNISAEPFYPSSVLKHFTYLKLRTTYGFSGNVDQRRSAVTTIIYTPVPAQYTNYTSAGINQYANPTLTWEKVSMVNLALDFATKNDVLEGSIEGYYKKGTNLFGETPVDYTTGIAQGLIRNVANITGRGVDVSLTAKPVTRQLSWVTTLLFNYNTGKVTRYLLNNTNGSASVNNGNTVSVVEGKPVYAIQSYRWGGLDSAGNPRGILDGKPSYDYAGITGSKTHFSDLVYSGPSTPSIYGSFNNTFSLKNFSLFVSLIYKANYYFRKQFLAYDQLLASSIVYDYDKRWQKPGDELITDVPAMVYPNSTTRNAVYTFSEATVLKGDHIRLNTINLTYTFNKTGKLNFLNNLQFVTAVSNLGILWRANKESIDPDYPNTLPPPKTITLALKALF